MSSDDEYVESFYSCESGSDDEIDDYDFKNLDDLLEKQCGSLKSLRKKLNWIYSDKGRYALLDQLYPVISDWKGQFPNLRDIFFSQEIEYLLTYSVKYTKEFVSNKTVGEAFIEFVARTGYKDELEIDDDDDELPLYCTTPLHHAARLFDYQESGTIRNLFEIYNRFDVNYINDGYTHFHVACKFGCNNVVEKFLELGQDLNCFEHVTGNSPLHFALAHDHKQVATMLLIRGADPNLSNNKGWTSLHFVCNGHYNDDFAELFFEICDNRHQAVHVDARNNEGNSPLHLALDHGSEKVIELLLRRGANPNLANGIRSIPLHNALLCHNEKVVELLLRYGADPNLTNVEGWTPLRICLKKKNFHMVKIFFEINDELNQRVQIDAKDYYGRTPLLHAVLNLKLDAVEILLDRGADLSSFIFPTANDFAWR
uniref:Uncharacterized protein n=1 Tax=Trichogramma kaykai TaxID=54128 RepID=A0ABD2XEU7_9HYME